MTDIGAFSARLGLDDAAVRQCLTAEANVIDKAMPWYVAALLGIAAWVASLLAVITGGFLAAQILSFEDSTMPLTIIALAFFGAGIWILRRAQSFFPRQCATALAVSGIVLAGIAVFLADQPAGVAALSAIILSGLGIALTRDLTFQALSGMTALGFVLFALLDGDAGLVHLWLALPLPMGCWLLIRPPAKDLRSLAVALLLAAPLSLIWAGYSFAQDPFEWTDVGVWLARAIILATIYGLLLPTLPTVPMRVILVIAALLVCISLPPAGSAGLAILALAYTLGSRLLALSGIIVTSYVLNAFYYDLDTSLLVKSGMLILAGCVFVGVWYLLSRKGRTT